MWRPPSLTPMFESMTSVENSDTLWLPLRTRLISANELTFFVWGQGFQAASLEPARTIRGLPAEPHIEKSPPFVAPGDRAA
jgi:hypothetical protein